MLSLLFATFGLSGRDLAPRAGQIVIGLQAQPELRVAPADALQRERSISADTAVCSCNSREKVMRATPRRRAASLTVHPASRRLSCRHSPRMRRVRHVSHRLVLLSGMYGPPRRCKGELS